MSEDLNRRQSDLFDNICKPVERKELPKPNKARLVSSRPVQQETPIEKSKPKVLQNAPKRPDTLVSKIVPLPAPTGRVFKKLLNIFISSLTFETRKQVKLIGNGVCVENTDQIQRVVNELMRKAKGNKAQSLTKTPNYRTLISASHIVTFFIPITAPETKQLTINIFKTNEDIDDKIRQLQDTEKRLSDLMENQKANEQFKTNVQEKLLDFIKTLTTE